MATILWVLQFFHKLLLFFVKLFYYIDFKEKKKFYKKVDKKVGTARDHFLIRTDSRLLQKDLNIT